jgi:RNA polymerase sigma factor (sigma-70 family)
MYEEDAALLAAVRDGSERAFNMLIDRHQQAVRVFLRGQTARDEADDIAQETFLAAWTNAKSFRGEASVRTWLCSIAWRKLKASQRAWFRGRRRDTTYHGMPPSDVGYQPAAADDHALHQALALLPSEQRAALMLCLGCGLSHRETAEALDMPLGTVKSHVLRGRERLREVLGEGS